MLNIAKQKRYLLACSYGPDSMALLKMLLLEGYDFDIAHVEYNIREDSKKETEDLLKYCKENNVQCFVYKVEEKLEKNVEEKCREIRYEFFHEIYLNDHYDALLVAHHQDDLLETYLLQKQRNILPRHYGLVDSSDLYGMHVIRPLLSYKKSDLLDFCREKQVPYALDYTNFLDIYARNKIRHQVIEKMNEEERNDLLKEIEDKNKVLEEKYAELEKLSNLTNEQLLNLDETLFRMYLTNLAREIESDFEVSKKVAREIKKVLLSNKPNVLAPVSDTLVFIKEYETCCFDINEESIDFHFIVEEPCIMDNEYFYLDFTRDTRSRNVTVDDYPLVIRNATKDDVYTILNYPVKVRRLFIDWKMPISLRKRWPIILNKDNRIVYIPRYQNGFQPDEKCNFYVKKRFSLKK
ncbi:MAG: tRNA lysidine(34) synthetase TilS [Bacilli bacterium]|nr:tRNA lysidine(34) synthetase TilS [Bacilli bacterium]